MKKILFAIAILSDFEMHAMIMPVSRDTSIEKCPVRAELIHLNYPTLVYIKGYKTEPFTTSDIVNMSRAETVILESLTKASSVFSNAPQAISQMSQIPQAVYAEKFILRTGNICLTDIQIQEKFLDSIIRNDLIIEPIIGKFLVELNKRDPAIGLGFLELIDNIKSAVNTAAKSPLSNPNEFIDIKEFEKCMNTFILIIGEEQFNLIAGEALLVK